MDKQNASKGKACRNKELGKDTSVIKSTCALKNSTGSNWKPTAQVQPGTDEQNKTLSLPLLAPTTFVKDVSKSY